jgi:HlyD family secretion protein
VASEIATPRPQAAPPAEEPEQSSEGPKRKRILLLAGAAVVLILLVLFLWRWLSAPSTPSSVIALSGRIEGDDSAIAAKVTGRLLRLTVREGDTLTAGQPIAFLDDAQTRAKMEQARAGLAQAHGQIEMAEHQRSVLEAQLAEIELGVGQSRTEAEGRVSEAQARLAAAQASLAQAEAAHKSAKFNADAFRKLLQQDEVSSQQATEAISAEESQAAVIEATRREVEAAQGALTAANAAKENPAIRQAQAEAVRRQIQQQQAQIRTFSAEASRANAQLTEAEANLSDLTVVAPFDGTVATRTAEPGEVLSSGTPIITLIDLNGVYLRGFVPEGSIGRVRVNQRARVYLDSAPHRALDAVVIRIDPEASFTPENTYFRNDRVKQVVGVKLRLAAPKGFAKPGMPADGEILVEGTEWPK